MRYFNQYALYADLRTLVVNVNMQYYGYLGTINRRLRRWSKMFKKLKSWKYERDSVYLFLTRDKYTCLPMAARGEKLHVLSNENLLVFYSFEWLFRYFMYVSRVILSFFLKMYQIVIMQCSKK